MRTKGPGLQRRVVAPVLTALLLAVGVAWAADASRVPTPNLTIERAGQCVADKETMRRDHMKFLGHQRDKTMRQGIRTQQFSLNGCIECHASSKTGSVAAAPDDFCRSCHAYAAVKIDCFDCHQPKRAAGVAQR